MQQATEITRIAPRLNQQVFEFSWVLLRCGILLAFIASLAGCSDKDRNDGSPGIEHDKSNVTRILRRGLPGEPRTLDPQLAEDTFSFPVLRDLYEGLTAEDREGQIVPGVAESWAVDNTGTIYTFLLRPNAKWSDGERILATEFVQGLRRAVDPQTASGSSAWLAVIKGATDVIAGRKKATDLGVTAIGDSTVRIELEHPAPFVLQVLSQPIAAPTHLHANANIRTLESGDKTKVSNGPYTLV